jgi:hypothetical protein
MDTNDDVDGAVTARVCDAGSKAHAAAADEAGETITTSPPTIERIARGARTRNEDREGMRIVGYDHPDGDAVKAGATGARAFWVRLVVP